MTWQQTLIVYAMRTWCKEEQINAGGPSMQHLSSSESSRYSSASRTRANWLNFLFRLFLVASTTRKWVGEQQLLMCPLLLLLPKSHEREKEKKPTKCNFLDLDGRCVDAISFQVPPLPAYYIKSESIYNGIRYDLFNWWIREKGGRTRIAISVVESRITK